MRKSNIELLRIVAMLLIIGFHYVYKSGYVFAELTVHSFIIKIFWFFGELGVNLFILIMGYFMSSKKKISVKKLVSLILEVNFYYIIILGITMKLDPNFILSPKYIFPIITNKFWFITAYIIIYILSPYFNLLIENMDQKKFKKFLITVITLWSIIPTIYGIFYDSTEEILYYSRFIWFIVLYFIGAYIKQYQKDFDDLKLIGKYGIASAFIMLISIIVFYRFKKIFNLIGLKEIAYFWTPNSIPMLILSVSIFTSFLKLNISNNKVINKFASATLGIYILHDNLLNKYIWEDIFHTLKKLNSEYFIFYIIRDVLIIFLIGAMIDFIRQWIEKITLYRIFNKIDSVKRSN